MIKLLGKIPANKWLDFYSKKYLLTFRPMHIKDINVILMIYFLLCYPIFKMWLELFGQCTSNTNKRFSPCRSGRLPSRFLGSGGTGGGGGCGGASGCGGGSPGADRVLYGGMVSTGGGGGGGGGGKRGLLLCLGLGGSSTGTSGGGGDVFISSASAMFGFSSILARSLKSIFGISS